MIRATRVRFYVRFLEQRGVHPEATLAGSGIMSGDLGKPEYIIEPVQLLKVIANVALLCPEPGVGLRLGAALRISDLGIMGHALMSCGTLADALPLWDGYNELIGTPIYNHHTFKGGLWIIDFSAAMPLGALLPLCLEEHLANIKVLNQFLVNAPMRFRDDCPSFETYYCESAMRDSLMAGANAVYGRTDPKSDKAGQAASWSRQQSSKKSRSGSVHRVAPITKDRQRDGRAFRRGGRALTATQFARRQKQTTGVPIPIGTMRSPLRHVAHSPGPWRRP